MRFPAIDFQSAGTAFAILIAWTALLGNHASQAADYTVSATSTAIVVTDLSGNGDALQITQPGSGLVKFAAAGRTFSINGGPAMVGNSGSVALGSVSAITVNAANGADQIVVGGFPGVALPKLTLNGGTGDDTVTFTGDLTFAAGLDVDLQNDGAEVGIDSVHVAEGVRLIAVGGKLVLRCSRSISVGPAAVLETVNNTLSVQANQQSTPTSGDFVGVHLNGCTLKTSGVGTIEVSGKGGDAAAGSQAGVKIAQGARILGSGPTDFSGFGQIFISGTAGASTGPYNRGVVVTDAGTELASSAESLTVTGVGGPNGSAHGTGVCLLAGAVIRGLGTCLVGITGSGGGAVGSVSNAAVEIAGEGTLVTTSGADLKIGIGPGAGTNSAIVVADSATISTEAAFANVRFSAGAIIIEPTTQITHSGSGLVSFENPGSLSAGWISLGGDDTPTELGLTDAELDRVFARTISIGRSHERIRISAPLTLNSHLDLTTLGGTATAPASGNDLTFADNKRLAVKTRLSCPISGPLPDVGFPQLTVQGLVYLDHTLDLNGTTLPGSPGDRFVIINNLSNFPIRGSFAPTLDGAYLPWPGSASMLAQITLKGGDGNDLVVTLVETLTALTVTSMADGLEVGTLRSAVKAAAARSGADTLLLSPGLSGQVISLSKAISVTEGSGVTVDASGLSAGLTLSGNQVTNLFSVSSNGKLVLKGLTLTDGGGDLNARAGAIDNLGTLTLLACTIKNCNVADVGGAILNNTNLARLTMEQCTLTGNAAGSGGALWNEGSVEASHCTIAGNAATAGAGGIHLAGGTATFSNCIIAGNSGPTEPDLGGAGPGPALLGANLVGQNAGAFASTLPPGIPNAAGHFIGTSSVPAGAGLAPLAFTGGPTPTLALLPGSLARDHSSASNATSDQRGFPIVGTADIGAYEAGTITNYTSWCWETLPATATASERTPDGDGDFDGRSNGLEFATLTDGGAPSATVLLLAERNAAGTEATLTIPYRAGIFGLAYVIERSASLLEWTPIVSIDSGLGAIAYLDPGISFDSGDAASLSFRDSTVVGQPHVFYRLRIALDL